MELSIFRVAYFACIGIDVMKRDYPLVAEAPYLIASMTRKAR